MDDELITSPIFPALFIMAVVSFIVFGLTRDYKLGFLTGFIFVTSLIIFLMYLDRDERQPVRHITPDIKLVEKSRDRSPLRKLLYRARRFFTTKEISDDAQG